MDQVLKLNNRVETMGLAATLTPFVKLISSSRIQMLSSHAGQAIAPAQSDIPRIMTGFETQLGEFTFNVKMPTNGIIRSIHRKFHYDASTGKQLHNPTTTIIYQCQETGIYDYLDIYEYHTRHKAFGCKFVISPIVDKLRPNMPIAKDTILAQSVNIKKGGIYSTSIEANVAYLSVPGVIEDGFRISESFAKKAAPLEMSSSVVEWGRKAYPLNIYGDENNYKPFPGVGDKIRPDGLVFALREYDTLFDALEMTPKSLMEVDMIHDIRVYGIAGAEVYDVIVESGIGESRSKILTPKGMETQAIRYINQISDYYQGIKNTYDSLVKETHGRLEISPQLQTLITRSIADKPNSIKSPANGGTSGIVRRVYKNNPLDEYRVEVKYFNRKAFDLGAKLTGRFGNKGVVCEIVPDSEMPTDKEGNIADILSFAKAAVSRLNPGQFFEHYMAAASRDLSKWIRENCNKIPHENIWQRLMEYYQAASPEQFNIVSKNYTSVSDQMAHVQSIIDSGIYLYISPDAEHINVDIFDKIEKVISPVYDRVSYVDCTGKRVTTKDPVFIGISDILILEKTEQRPMAVSSASLQHHGLISGNNRETRNAHPSKQQSTRVFGETEARLIAAILGGDILAEFLDLANCPESHRQSILNILDADQPFNIENIVDRNELPLGRSRVLSLFNHVLLCAGVEIVDN